MQKKKSASWRDKKAQDALTELQEILNNTTESELVDRVKRNGLDKVFSEAEIQQLPDFFLEIASIGVKQSAIEKEFDTELKLLESGKKKPNEEEVYSLIERKKNLDKMVEEFAKKREPFIEKLLANRKAKE